MAEKRTINIDIKNNADETAKDFDTLNKSIDNTTKSTKNLNSTFEEVYGELQPLTTRMGEAEDRLYELALAGDTASKEYQELLTKVGEYRKVQIQTDLAVDAAATTLGQKLGGALTGATSGFAAVQGVMGLVGSESEALEKTLLKVQSALAIQQGVQGVLDYAKSAGLATKATKLWNLALKANPIGLVIAGVVSLIAAVGALAASFETTADKREKEHQEQLKQIESTKQEIAQRVAQLKLEDRYRQSRLKGLELDREVATSKEEIARIDAEIHDEKMQAFEDEKQAVREQQKDAIASATARLVALKKQETESYKGGLFFSESKEKQALFSKYVIDQRAYVSKITKQLEEDNFQSFIEIDNKKREYLQTVSKEEIAEEKATNETKLQNYKDYLQARVAALRYIEDLQFAITEEGVEKEVAMSNKNFDRLIEDALKNEEFSAKEKNRIKDLLLVQQFENEDRIRQRYYDKENADRVERLDFVKELNTAEVESEKAKNLAIIESSKEAAAKQKEIDEKAAQEKADRQNAAIDLAVQGFQLIAGIAEAFAGEDIKRQKKAFQIKKVADIASATVDGYRAVLSTYAQTPGGPVIKGIAAGLAGSFAALQIANIAKQQFQGGGDGSDVSVSADAGGGEAATPQFNVVGDSGINQIAQLQQQPVQAFVVSGEVTTSQALDRNRVQNATL